MNKISKNQKGFSAVEIVLVITVIVLLGAVGWLAYRNHHRTSPALTQPAPIAVTKAKTPTPPVNTYAGWQTYDSKLGAFTLKYPAGWSITGFQGYTPVNQSQFNGDETELYISEYPESTMENNLGIVVNVNSTAPAAITTYNAYANGTAELLSNGLTLWQENLNENFANGPATDTCPNINIGTDSTFSTKLSNGEYLSMYASYCWAQKMTTSYSYEQQLGSAAWADAINVVKSVNL